MGCFRLEYKDCIREVFGIKIKSIVSKVIDFILNIIYPPKCIFCGKVLEPNCNLYICGACSNDIKFCSESICCEKCGKPIVSYGSKKLCYHCLNNSCSFTKAISVFTYEDLVKKALLKFKSTGLKGHSDLFVSCMSARFYEEYSDINFDLICGAPPHDKKKDFDQVDILCKKLSLIIDIPYKRKVFIQTRKTLKQSTLGYKERQKNLKDSLCIKDKTITDGKTILLIDDICTTRSTLNECARALKAGGAKKIYALTVATVNNPE